MASSSSGVSCRPVTWLRMCVSSDAADGSGAVRMWSCRPSMPSRSVAAPALDHAVGVEDDAVAGPERDAREGERLAGEQSERREHGAAEIVEVAVRRDAARLRVAEREPFERAVRVVPARQQGRHEHRRVAEPEDRAIHLGGRLGERPARLARRAQRGQRQGGEGGRARALAGGVGDGQPRAAAIGDVLEPIASDVVGREHRAGDLGPADPGDPRRQEQLLELGSGRRALPVPRAGRAGRCSGATAPAPLRRAAAKSSSAAPGVPSTRNTAIARCRSHSGTTVPSPRAANSRSSAARWPVGISGPAICGIGTSSGNELAPASRRSATPSRSTT